MIVMILVIVKLCKVRPMMNVSLYRMVNVFNLMVLLVKLLENAILLHNKKSVNMEMMEHVFGIKMRVNY